MRSRGSFPGDHTCFEAARNSKAPTFWKAGRPIISLCADVVRARTSLSAAVPIGTSSSTRMHLGKASEPHPRPELLRGVKAGGAGQLTGPVGVLTNAKCMRPCAGGDSS